MIVGNLNINSIRNKFELIAETIKLTNVLNTHATNKTKTIRFNNNIFMTKEIRKEIMKRSKLRKKFNRNRNHVGAILNLVELLCNPFKENEKQYYENLSFKNVMETQIF